MEKNFDFDFSNFNNEEYMDLMGYNTEKSNEIFDFNSSPFNNICSEIDKIMGQEGGSLEEENFTIEQTSSKTLKKFDIELKSFEINLKDLNNKKFGDLHDSMEKIFLKLKKHFLSMMTPSDKIRVIFFHDSLMKPISIPFRNKMGFESENMLDSFERVAQSYRNVEITRENSLKCVVAIAKLPYGSKTK